jgi:hypothetical protein
MSLAKLNIQEHEIKFSAKQQRLVCAHQPMKQLEIFVLIS